MLKKISKIVFSAKSLTETGILVFVALWLFIPASQVRADTSVFDQITSTVNLDKKIYFEKEPIVVTGYAMFVGCDNITAGLNITIQVDRAGSLFTLVNESVQGGSITGLGYISLSNNLLPGEHFIVASSYRNGEFAGEQILFFTVVLDEIDIGLRINQGTAVTPDIAKIAVERFLTSPLRIAKNGVAYSVKLVDPADSNSTKTMIQLPAGNKKSLKRYHNPIPEFTAAPKVGMPPLTVQFTDKSDWFRIDSWQWDFNNDGIIDSFSQNPSYTYSSLGKYTVSLTISDSDETIKRTKADYINVINKTPVGITFSVTCNTFSFAIAGESGHRDESDLIFTRDGKGRIVHVKGNVTYGNSGRSYEVGISVTWGSFCISNVAGQAWAI